MPGRTASGCGFPKPCHGPMNQAARCLGPFAPAPPAGGPNPFSNRENLGFKSLDQAGGVGLNILVDTASPILHMFRT